MGGLGTVAAGLVMGGSALAAGQVAPTTPLSFRHFSFGAWTLDFLWEGSVKLPVWPTWGGAATTESELRQDMLAHGDSGTEQALPVQMLLLRGQGRCILVDAGYGPHQRLRPGAGLLQHSLAAAGVSPESVDTVLVTHAHPDHLWGCVEEGRFLFPRARYLVGKKELQAALLPESALAALPSPRQAVARETVNRLESLLPQATPLEGGEQIAPGLRLRLLPGHTPGHLGLELDGDGRRLLHAVDCFPHPSLFFRHPDWHYALDADPRQAVAIRRLLLRELTEQNLYLSGCHFAWPGIGRVRTRGGGLVFEPLT